MPQAPKIRRRWYQFGLGTMFVLVTVVGAFFAYHVNWIKQRHEARAWLGMQMIGGSFAVPLKPPSSFPWMLKLLGEEPNRLILMRHGPTEHYQGRRPIPDEYLQLVHRVEKLFPEAVVKDVTWKAWDDEEEEKPESAPQS